MLTYDLNAEKGPLYAALAQYIKEDITAGNLHAGERLPSKRTLARNNGVSTITVQNAYDQLVSEGYVVTEERRGYFVAEIHALPPVTGQRTGITGTWDTPVKPSSVFDFSANHTDTGYFPFSIWARLTNDSGLHFLLQLATDMPDAVIQRRLATQGIRLRSVRDYSLDAHAEDRHEFLLNYSSLDTEKLPAALQALKQVMQM